jgi:hypothetical protein
MSKGKDFEPPEWEHGLQPSAFTTVKSVEEAAAKAIAKRLSVYRRNFHAVSSRSALWVGRLIVVRFHIPFWRRVRSSGGKQKAISPERKKWPTIASDC